MLGRKRRESRMADNRLNYIVMENGKPGDAWPLVRDAENICRQSATRTHSCERCPSRKVN